MFDWISTATFHRAFHLECLKIAWFLLGVAFSNVACGRNAAACVAPSINAS